MRLDKGCYSACLIALARDEGGRGIVENAAAAGEDMIGSAVSARVLTLVWERAAEGHRRFPAGSPKVTRGRTHVSCRDKQAILKIAQSSERAA